MIVRMIDDRLTWYCQVFASATPIKEPGSLRPCVDNRDGSHDNCGWVSPMGFVGPRSMTQSRSWKEHPRGWKTWTRDQSK